jgi:hypothetical protein
MKGNCKIRRVLNKINQQNKKHVKIKSQLGSEINDTRLLSSAVVLSPRPSRNTRRCKHASKCIYISLIKKRKEKNRSCPSNNSETNTMKRLYGVCMAPTTCYEGLSDYRRGLGSLSDLLNSLIQHVATLNYVLAAVAW